MNIFIPLLLFLLIIILTILIIVVVRSKKSSLVNQPLPVQNDNLKTKRPTKKKYILIVAGILAVAACIIVRVYVAGPNISKITDNITKETQFDSVKNKFLVDSVFGKVSVSEDNIDVYGKFRYSGVAFKDDVFEIHRIDGRNQIDNMRLLGRRIDYADTQKILNYLEQIYGEPYKVIADDKSKKGEVDLSGELLKETTCIYGLDYTDSINNNSDLAKIFNKGNYVILDITEEAIFGSSYYNCEILWCYTNNANWKDRIWNKSENPNMIYLQSLIK